MDVRRSLDELRVMEVAVARKGFDAGVRLGDAATHEIRALICHPRADDTVVIASGDKWGALRVGVFARLNGAPMREKPWRVVPWLPAIDDTHRVIDALAYVATSEREWLAVGTRGNGAWLISLDEALYEVKPFKPVQLPGSEDRVVRRLLYDAPSRTLWASLSNQPEEPVETRLVAWEIDHDTARIVTDIDTRARVTALSIDAGPSQGEDQLYIATNLSALYRLSRSPNGMFEVEPTTLNVSNAVWRGRSSVIESLIALSRIERYDEEHAQWVRRFSDRGVVATTLRHVMVMSDGGEKGLLCDVRRVAVFSKILAAAPVCLPKWSGIAVATLDRMLRIFRPSGIRRPSGDFVPYCEDAPENAEPRSLIGGYEDIEMRERTYALATLRPRMEGGDEYATVVLGMGDHTVRFNRFRAGWAERESATQLAQEIVRRMGPENLLQYLENEALHSYKPSADKYAASVLLPELGVLCRTPELWRRLKLLVWDVLAGTDSPALQKVPVHIVQSLRRLQMLYPEKQEEVEQTILGIRKHIFDKQSFSSKSHDFLSLTKSTDPDLSDDRVVYQSILISRRHDPVFNQRFTGEVRSFASVRTSEDDAGSPNAWRFLVGTYRGTLSIFDAGGTGCEVDGISHELWGHVQSMLVSPHWIVFSFSKGTIRRVARQELDRPLGDHYALSFDVVSGHESPARCLAPLPGADEHDERFLWGDASGRIRIAPSGEEIARVKHDDLAYGDVTINVLQSFVTHINGTERRFFAAGTDLGEVYLYEWQEGRASTECDRVSVGSGAVATMLVHRVGLTQIVAGCTDGNVTGLWVAENEGHEPALSIYWSYRTADAVHDIQPLPVNVGTGDKHDRLLGIASHDQHLHVIDHVGRHLETVFLDKVKLDHFAAVPDTDGGGVVECRIFGCAFENDFFAFRLISRREMLDRLGRFVEGLRPEERERRLTRWRAFAIREDHLRRRFVRESRRYPGPDARSAIDEIHRLMQVGSTDEGPTAAVTALLRRLFQNQIPGELKPTGQIMGLREILLDREGQDLYTEVVKLLHELEEQWDTPGSGANRRVQYFWIRSLLRNIADMPMLRNWLERSEEACSKVRLAEPVELLYHFLERPNEVVQFKVLQCVERMLFGWPGVKRSGVISSSEAVVASDIDWLLRALLLRLRNDTSQHRANVVALQIGKMFCELIRTGSVDALHLAYDMLELKIPAGVFTTLAGQCSVMAHPGARASVHDRTQNFDKTQQRARNRKEDDRLLRAAELFRALNRLDDHLTKRRETATIIDAVDHVVAYCDANPASSQFLTDTAWFYSAVKPLLGIRTLSDITNLPSDLLPDCVNGTCSKSYARLAEFRAVIDKLRVYYEKKYNDTTVTKLEALTFESFDDARSAWRALRDTIRSDDHELRPRMLEYLLLKKVAEVWEEVLVNEQNEELLRDLVEVVQQEALDSGPQHPNATVAIAKLQQAEEFMARALENFLIRLVLFSEPKRAALFHRSRETNVTAYVFDAERTAARAISQVDLDQWPQWLDRRWVQPARVSDLTDESVKEFLTTAGTGLQWESIEIPDIGESNARFGYFVFGWDDQAEGAARFASAKLLWNLLLQSLVFRKASLQRDVMTSRVFAMVAHNLGSPVVQIRTYAELLLDDLLDTEEAKREKYAQILRQGCHMHGIMDAILSIDGRESKPAITEISLASLVHEVVRTERTQTRKAVKIDFRQPSEKMISDTTFFTDEIRVYDILLNLLGNAVKYSPKNGTVWVTVTVKSHGAEIRVRDQGPGIPDDEKLRVFQPWVRGRSSVHRKIGGLGLGLYVVDLYTKSLRGRVHIQDESPRGTSFIVYLPTWVHLTSHPQPQEPIANAHPPD